MRISAALVLAALLGAEAGCSRGPNRIVVRNAGPTPLTKLRLTLAYEGVPSSTYEHPQLAPGESWTTPHQYNDSRASLMFTSGATTHTFESGYIDLWAGEGWLLEIQPDGSVKQGYDYPGHRPQ